MDAIPEDHDEVGPLVHPKPMVKPSHRRVWSIGMGGAIELDKITKDQKVEILQTELERQSKALEESQEETQLAARIGQSLLIQNQQLDYEWEAKLAKTLTKELTTLHHDYKQLESARLRTDVELDHLRLQNADLKHVSQSSN
ncbi:hypothetical protein ACHHYP_11667 [Achlya hypogyna]|uniref:Uncharacterized protein n=1 Tax=Achlya hypogyna TaxID=1202772 RepID=A0A1V9YIP8_ACHHY|nr:hypothetical protein ACHHYP_11667 [Achlya hypogyna]